jgi:hypothetical protein
MPSRPARPAGRHGRDQMGRDTGGVGQVKLPAQRDDDLAVDVTDAEIYVKHDFPPEAGRESGPSG